MNAISQTEQILSGKWKEYTALVQFIYGMQPKRNSFTRFYSQSDVNFKIFLSLQKVFLLIINTKTILRYNNSFWKKYKFQVKL